MTGPKPRPGILEMPEYMRGLARLNGRDRVIKLSSNENPLGPNPAAREAAAAALAESHLYPEAGAGVLAEAVARRHGLDPDRLVFGAGSDPLLSMLVRTYAGPGDEVVFSATGFARFRLYTMAAGAVPVAAPDHDFSVDVDALLARVGRRTRLVMLASPDNPTGSYVPAAALERLHAGLPDDVVLVVDAAYGEYARADDYASGRALAETAANVVMARTFSKIHGLAAIRLGWLYAPDEVVRALRLVEPSFPLSGPALGAGIAAMADTTFADGARAHNDTWLPWLVTELTELGLRVHPSQANFALVQFPSGDAAADAANAHLQAHGILVRLFPAAAFGDCLRITIGRADELKATVAALRAFLGSPPAVSANAI